MKKLVIALVSTLLFAQYAWAESACEAKAVEKKLAGAAKASFLKKCERESQPAGGDNAQPACEAKAAEKKLAGAAKASFTKKCVADAGK